MEKEVFIKELTAELARRKKEKREKEKALKFQLDSYRDEQSLKISRCRTWGSRRYKR